MATEEKIDWILKNQDYVLVTLQNNAWSKSDFILTVILDNNSVELIILNQDQDWNKKINYYSKSWTPIKWDVYNFFRKDLEP